MSKITWIIIIVVVVGVVVGGVFLWQEYTSSEAYLTNQFVEEWERRYMEDTVGGETPEETLELFIEALEAGDVDKAAEYFVVDAQAEERQRLQRVKDDGLLDEMIRDMKDLEFSGKTEDKAFFVLTDETNLVVVQVIIRRNTLNDTWKITEL